MLGGRGATPSPSSMGILRRVPDPQSRFFNCDQVGFLFPLIILMNNIQISQT